MTETTQGPRKPRRRTRATVAKPIPAAELDLDEADEYAEDYAEDDDYPEPPPSLNRAARRRAQRNRNTRQRSGPAPINIEDDGIDQIPIKLLGEDFLITPPKAGPMLAVARSAANGTLRPGDETNAIDDWVFTAFGDEDGERILDRMEDPDEVLDLKHIQQLMAAVSKYVTKQPPM